MHRRLSTTSSLLPSNMVSPGVLSAPAVLLQFQNGGRHCRASDGWSSRLLLRERQLFSLLNLDSTRGWEGQCTALGEDRRGKWKRQEGVSLWMGEGASWALREGLAPTPSQSPLEWAPGVSVATVPVVLGRNAQRGKEVTSPWVWRFQSFVAVRTIQSHACFPLLLLFPSAFTGSALEELIRRQPWLLT